MSKILCSDWLYPRLDYQPLFGKMSPHSSTRKSGWARAISFVDLSQSCYRLQIFVWQRLSKQKVLLDGAETLGEILDPEGTQRFVRLFVVNSSFNDCCWRDFDIFKDLFKAL